VTEARVSWAQDPLPRPAGCPAARVQNLVTAEASSGGARAAVTQSMTAGDAGEVIHSLADEPDVTVTASGSPPAGKVMIAVLADPDGCSVVLAPDEPPGRASPGPPNRSATSAPAHGRANHPQPAADAEVLHALLTLCDRRRTQRGAHRRRYLRARKLRCRAFCARRSG